MNKESYIRHKALKIIGIIASALIILTLNIIVNAPPIHGYEISIYGVFGWHLWFSIILAIACGIGILMLGAFETGKSRLWIFGFILVIIGNIIIILMPLFRGYFMTDMSDEISHLGLIKDIAMTGHIGKNNVYPIAHILSYSFIVLSNLDSKIIIRIIPSTFYLLYMFGLYLLSNYLCEKFGQTLFVMAFGSVLLFTYYHYLFLPTQFFLCMLPLLLFLFFKKSKSGNSKHAAIFIILLLMMPLLHPLGSVFLLTIFLLLALVNTIYPKFYKNNTSKYTFNSRDELISAAIIFIIFFMWFINFAMFQATLNQAYDWFVHGYGTPAISILKENYKDSGLAFLELIKLILNTYGHNIIFSVVTLLALLKTAKNIIYKKSTIRREELFLFILFLFFAVFFILTLLGNFIVTGGSQRIFCWALFASIIINGIVSFNYLTGLKDKYFRLILCILFAIIIISAVVGIFSVYPSPHIKSGNLQVTTMDWAGMVWFFNHKTSNDTIYFSQLPYRAPGYLYGFSMLKPETIGQFYPVPSRLGYDKNISLAKTIDLDSYMIVSESTRIAKENLWPDRGQYILNDLIRIEYDSGIERIYSSRGLDIYLIMK